MASKFVQQKGRYFFLSNSISIYTKPLEASRHAKPVLPDFPSSQLVNPKFISKTNYFLRNCKIISQIEEKNVINSTENKSFWSKIASSTFWTKSNQPSSMQLLINMPIAIKSSFSLPPWVLRPTFVDTLKASIFPSSFPRRAYYRSYATFRDLGYQGSGGGGRGQGQWMRLLQFFKVPVLFTLGVCAFNAFLLPYFFMIPVVGPELYRHPVYIIYGLMGLNLAVFAAWKSPRSFGRQLYRYFLLHKDGQFNKWQMIGSAFSHQEIWHLAINMFVLYQFGRPLAQWVGSKNFLEMYLDSAAIASLGSIALPVILNRFTSMVVLSNVPSLGASGAIFSLFGVFSYLSPYARLSLFFIPLPIGAWYVFLLTMGYNALGMGFRWARTDYAGHFAGCAAGILFGYIFSEKMRKQREHQRRITTFRVF